MDTANTILCCIKVKIVNLSIADNFHYKLFKCPVMRIRFLVYSVAANMTWFTRTVWVCVDEIRSSAFVASILIELDRLTVADRWLTNERWKKLTLYLGRYILLLPSNSIWTQKILNYLLHYSSHNMVGTTGNKKKMS